MAAREQDSVTGVPAPQPPAAQPTPLQGLELLEGRRRAGAGGAARCGDADDSPRQSSASTLTPPDSPRLPTKPRWADLTGDEDLAEDAADDLWSAPPEAPLENRDGSLDERQQQIPLSWAARLAGGRQDGPRCPDARAAKAPAARPNTAPSSSRVWADRDAGDADSSLSQSRQGPPWARGGAKGEARGWSDGASGWSDGARGWSDGARGWSDGAKGWSDGAKSRSAGAQGWSDGAKGWSENRGWSDGAAKGKGRSDGAAKGHAKGEAKGQAMGQAKSKGKGKGKGKDDDARHSLRKLQCQFLVGIEEEPGFRVIKRVLGAAGANMKRIASETDAKLRLRGRGSGFLEGPERQEAPEHLMLCVSATDPESYALAVRHIQDLLTGIYAEYSKFCARDGERPPDLEVQLHEGPRQGAFASRSSGDAR